MKSLKTRLATLAIAACGVGAAAAQTVLIVPLEASGDYGYTATGPYGPSAESIVVVPEPTVVIVPESTASSGTTMDSGALSSTPDTTAMGAGPANHSMGAASHTGTMGAPADMNRRGEPLASTTQASTSLRPDVFNSADGTPAALGGGTRMPEGVYSHDIPPAQDASGRVLRGNVD